MDKLLSFDDPARSSLLSLILDNVDVGVMVYSAAGDILFVNTTMINWRNIPPPGVSEDERERFSRRIGCVRV